MVELALLCVFLAAHKTYVWQILFNRFGRKLGMGAYIYISIYIYIYIYIYIIPIVAKFVLVKLLVVSSYTAALATF